MGTQPPWDDILGREIQIRAIAHASPDVREASWAVLVAALHSIIKDEVGQVAWDQDFLRQIEDGFPGIADGVKQSTTRVELLLELHRRLTETGDRH